MWIVRLALDRPYTFIVFAVLILLLGVYAIQTTPTDIFPKIDIPVVSIIWTYSGLPTPDMEKRVTTFSEFVWRPSTIFARSNRKLSPGWRRLRCTSTPRFVSTRQWRRSIPR